MMSTGKVWKVMERRWNRHIALSEEKLHLPLHPLQAINLSCLNIQRDLVVADMNWFLTRDKICNLSCFWVITIDYHKIAWSWRVFTSVVQYVVLYISLKVTEISGKYSLQKRKTLWKRKEVEETVKTRKCWWWWKHCRQGKNQHYLSINGK